MNTPSQSISINESSHFYFVTGRLAEAALREVVQQLASEKGFPYSIGVMPITVAALMTPQWLLRHLQVPPQATMVIVPGYLQDHEATLAAAIGLPVRSGPRDLRQLPEFFGGKSYDNQVMTRHDIEIIAEINHAPRLSIDQLLDQAQQLLQQGADRIDIGCDPSVRWTQIGDAFAALTAAGITTSVDTFDSWEAATACQQGASLVLSVNSTNRQACVDWGAEVVVIPDTPDDIDSMHQTIAFLRERDIPMRLDPILEPIGFSFAASLLRYAQTRNRYPDLAIMMGIGNLTEMTDVDSAGVNFLLLALCQEWQIHSVLTTQVINWARSSVRECDLARRLVHYSLTHRTPPKRLSDQLLVARDARLRGYSDEVLDKLAADIRDHNYRLFTQDDQIHAVSAGLHLRDPDPFMLFAQLLQSPLADNIDPSHAFYLGYEMAKAHTAITLGKQYEQDQALDWGYLTRPEQPHRLERKKRQVRPRDDQPDDQQP